MKKLIKEYLNIIAFATIGLVLIISGFNIMMNYYHSEELKRYIYVNPNDLNYQNYQNKLVEIDANLAKFQKTKKTNAEYSVMYSKLYTCNSLLKGSGTLATLKGESVLKPNEVYDLGIKLQSDLLNICWSNHLSYLAEEQTPKAFKDEAPYIEDTINSIANQTNFALSEIQNNSSYFYTTSITSSTIRNYLSADYSLITRSYNDFADIILNLSRKINEESTGGQTNE